MHPLPAPPSADTFVSSSTPKLNCGPSIILAVGPGANSYVQFNLSGIPSGATIGKATLRLYVDAVSGMLDCLSSHLRLERKQGELPEILFVAEITFHRLDRCMPQ